MQCCIMPHPGISLGFFHYGQSHAIWYAIYSPIGELTLYNPKSNQQKAVCGYDHLAVSNYATPPLTI